MMLPLFRLYQQDGAEAAPLLDSPDAIMEYCRALFLGQRYEQFYVLALDHRGRLLLRTLISSGDEGRPRSIPG